MKNWRRALYLLAGVSLIAGKLACENAQEVLLPNEYRSPKHGFTFRFGEHWKLRTDVSEKGIEVMLACADSMYGLGSTITFGVLYDAKTANLSQQEVLSMANSHLLTINIKNLPLVSSVTVYEEGKTRLGNQPAYQVRMTLEFTNGQKRIRHTFFTFSNGYWYNVSVHADPENYAAAITTARDVIKSFRLQ